MALGIGAASTNSMFALNAMRINNLLFSQTSAQLSSGNRLISGAIDPSGLAISMMMRSQIGGTDQAIYNTQDNINLVQTADATLGTQSDILGRMKELSVRAGNDATLTAQDRATLDNEYQSLANELNRQGQAANFNTKPLTTDVAGQQYGTQAAQIGPNSSPANQANVTINPSTGTTLGVTGQTLTTQAGALAANTAVDQAIQAVSTQRANLGAQQNTFTYTANDLNQARINLAAANSGIADTNFATTITDMTKSLLLNRVHIAALSQSNAQGFGVLKLLGA